MTHRLSNNVSSKKDWTRVWWPIYPPSIQICVC